jgi:hypothetical protein
MILPCRTLQSRAAKALTRRKKSFARYRFADNPQSQAADFELVTNRRGIQQTIECLLGRILGFADDSEAANVRVKMSRPSRRGTRMLGLLMSGERDGMRYS